MFLLQLHWSLIIKLLMHSTWSCLGTKRHRWMWWIWSIMLMLIVPRFSLPWWLPIPAILLNKKAQSKINKNFRLKRIIMVLVYHTNWFSTTICVFMDISTHQFTPTINFLFFRLDHASFTPWGVNNAQLLWNRERIKWLETPT